MDQLTLSFREEFLLKLKSSNWEFESRPENLEKVSPDKKFVQLDQSSSDSRPGNTDKNNPLKNTK